MPPPPLPLHAGSTPLANQVAGHQNVLSDESGALVIKPALPREIAFYQLLQSASRSSQVGKLKPFVPQFYGTLRLEGKVDGAGGITQEGVGVKVDDVPESVVLGNLAHSYTRPSILDVKLGTKLASDDASEEKKARMEKQAKGTTSWETGVRLTGCQTWHAPSQSYILTPKTYGKSISAAELPAGLRRFFPLPSDDIPALEAPSSPPPSSSAPSPPPGMSTPVSHLPLPSSTTKHTSVPPITPSSASSSASKTYTSHGISRDLLLRLLRLIDREVEALQAVLQSLEARFIGSSILLIYEGDPLRLSDALERYEAHHAKLALLQAEREAAGEVERQDSDEEIDSEDDDGESDSTSSDDDEDDGAAADARKARRCPPFTLKMIDFAHTTLVEGDGPDEGVLKGINTLRNLVAGRIAEIERAET